MKNIFIRISGFFKRLSRLARVFFTQNKSVIKYTSLGLASVISIAVIIILLSGVPLDLSFLSRATPTPTQMPAPTATQVPTPAPAAHIYGNSPLVILDASEFNDSGYIAQVAQEFGVSNDLPGEYHKVGPAEFLDAFAQMAEAGNTPNLVIAPNSLLIKLGAFEDISRINSEVLFNNAAKGALKGDRIPIALKMYGYFFRVDLLFPMSHDVPREYDELERLGKRLRSDFAYEHLKYSEENELLAERKDLFQTSRYGFGFPGGDVGGQLFAQQGMAVQFEGGSNILYEIKYMWDEVYLPPDTAYASDGVIEQAYINDALVGVFAPATLYEQIYKYSELFNNTQVKPYLGKDPVFTADVIYCAVPGGGDAEVAANFLSMLYNGGNLDKIIAQNHTAWLPVSNFLNPNTPWKNAMNEDSKMIYYENGDYTQVIKYIILAGEDVESALTKSQK